MSQQRVKEILSWYPALTSQQKKNLLRIINYGRIGGSGKFVILPVDQGFEHGPGRSFEANLPAYNPLYHVELAIKAGCNAYAAPLGALEAASNIIAQNSLPTILKVNNHDSMMPDDNDPLMSVNSWVEDAVRLGCAAVGFTIYPGSKHAQTMYQQARDLIADARKAGLIVVIWAYARGSGLPSEEAETAIDVVSYSVHIAAQLGAHIIKCKAPKAKISLPDHLKRKTYKNVPIKTLADRLKIVVRSAFDGRRIVINSGGDTKATADILAEVKELKKGGSFGSIVGRNAFQRPMGEAVKLLHSIQDIHTA